MQHILICPSSFSACHNQKGYFYLCGQAGQTEMDIKNSIYESFAEHGNMTMEEAKAEFEKMGEEGRYCPELY